MSEITFEPFEGGIIPSPLEINDLKNRFTYANLTNPPNLDTYENFRLIENGPSLVTGMEKTPGTYTPFLKWLVNETYYKWIMEKENKSEAGKMYPVIINMFFYLKNEDGKHVALETYRRLVAEHANLFTSPPFEDSSYIRMGKFMINEFLALFLREFDEFKSQLISKNNGLKDHNGFLNKDGTDVNRARFGIFNQLAIQYKWIEVNNGFVDVPFSYYRNPQTSILRSPSARTVEIMRSPLSSGFKSGSSITTPDDFSPTSSNLMSRSGNSSFADLTSSGEASPGGSMTQDFRSNNSVASLKPLKTHSGYQVNGVLNMSIRIPSHILDEKYADEKKLPDGVSKFSMPVKPAPKITKIYASACVTFDDNGIHQITINRDPYLIDGKYHMCEIHSGFSKLSNFSSLKPKFDFKAYCGFITDNGTCYDNCHTLQLFPLLSSEINEVIKKAISYETITDMFKNSADSLKMKVLSLTNIKKLSDRYEAELKEEKMNKTKYTTSELNITNELVEFLSNSFFIATLEKAARSGKGRIDTNVSQKEVYKQIDIIDNTILSSFFGIEGKIYDKLFTDKVEIFCAFVNPEEQSFTEQKITVPNTRELANIIDSIVGSETEFVVFSLDFSDYDGNPAFKITYNLDDVTLPEFFVDQLKAINKTNEACDLVLVIRKSSRIVINPNFEAVNIPSYDLNCHNYGSDILKKLKIFQITENKYFNTKTVCMGIGSIFINYHDLMDEILSSDYLDMNYTVSKSANDVIYIIIDGNTVSLTESVMDSFIFDDIYNGGNLQNAKLFVMNALISGMTLKIRGIRLNIESVFNEFNPIYRSCLNRSDKPFTSQESCVKLNEIMNNSLAIDVNISNAKYKMLNQLGDDFFNAMFASLFVVKGKDRTTVNITIDNFDEQIRNSKQICLSKMRMIDVLHSFNNELLDDFSSDVYGNSEKTDVVNGSEFLEDENSFFIENIGDSSFYCKSQGYENQMYKTYSVFSKLPRYYSKSTNLNLVDILQNSEVFTSVVSDDIFENLPTRESQLKIEDSNCLHYFDLINSNTTVDSRIRISDVIPEYAMICHYFLRKLSEISTVKKFINGFETVSIVTYKELGDENLRAIEKIEQTVRSLSKLSAVVKFYKALILEESSSETLNSIIFIREITGLDRPSLKKKIEKEIETARKNNPGADVIAPEKNSKGVSGFDDWVNYLILKIRVKINRENNEILDSVLNTFDFGIMVDFFKRKDDVVLTIKNFLKKLNIQNSTVVEKLFGENDFVSMRKISQTVNDKMFIFNFAPTNIFNCARKDVKMYLPLSERVNLIDTMINNFDVKDQVKLQSLKNVLSLYIFNKDIDVFKSSYDKLYNDKGKKYVRSSSIEANFRSVLGENIGVISTIQKQMNDEKSLLKNIIMNISTMSKKYEEEMINYHSTNDLIDKESIIIRKIYIETQSMITMMFYFYDKNKFNNTELQNALRNLKKNVEQLDIKLKEINLNGLTIIQDFRVNIIDLFTSKIAKSRDLAISGYNIQEIVKVFDDALNIMESDLKESDAALDPSFTMNEKILSLSSNTEANSIVLEFYKTLISNIKKIETDSRVKKLDGISFYSRSKYETVFDSLNKFNGKLFSDFSVDNDSFVSFVREQKKVESFVKEILEAMSILDNGPGFKFTSMFCRLLFEYKVLQSSKGDDIEFQKEEIKSKINLLRTRVFPFNITNCISSHLFSKMVSILNGKFFGFYETIVSVYRLNPLVSNDKITEAVVRDILFFFSSDNTNFDEYVEKYDAELLINVCNAFEKYTDEYVIKDMRGNYQTLNDSLVLELRKKYILKSKGECYREIFSFLARFLNNIRQNNEQKFNSNIRLILSGYISGIIQTFNGKSEIETYMIKRYFGK
jgi:hypothetical protein